MKKLQLLKTIAGMLVLVILLGSCSSNTLPAFSLTKGITENAKKSGTSKDSSWKNNNSTDNNNSQNGTGEPQGQGKPDLVVVSLEPGDGMPVKGKWEVWEAETYKNGVIATIKNAGTADITTLFKVGVYARYNNPNVYYSYTYLSDGVQIGEADVTDLKAGEAKKIPITLDNIPNNTYIGKNNYIGLYVDCEEKIKESDEDNNKGGYNKAFKEYQRDDKTLHFLEVHENRPDIVALSFNPPSTLKKGVESSASVTIKNTGHRGTTLSFKVGVYARYNNPNVYYSYTYLSDGVKIGELSVDGLGVNETKELAIPLLLNESYYVDKDIYIGVWVDNGSVIKEMDREWQGEGDYNKGGYDKNTKEYVYDNKLLKRIFYSE